MPTLKAGVIGCGNIARRAHLPAYRDLGVEVVGVADSDEKRAIRCARRFKVKNHYTNYEELLQEKLDLVSICTPPSTHCEITTQVAAAGANVIVEKPMASSLADADRMIQACREARVKLCVVQNYRFFPCLMDAKNRIRKGRIGNVVSIHAIGRDFIDVMDTAWRFEKWGVLDDFGPHMIDMINFLTDSSMEHVKVFARDYTGNLGCITHLQALILLRNSTAVDLDISWMTGAFELSLKILGTAGTLDIDVRSNHLREIHGYSTPLEELKASLGKTWTIAKAVANRSYFKGPLLYHKVIIDKFIQSIAEGTTPPVSGEEGREVVAAIEAIKYSADQKHT